MSENRNNSSAKKKAEAVFLLDMSGSMSPLKRTTLDGFNSMINEERSNENSVKVTTVLFNTELFRAHDRMPITDVPELTETEYEPQGRTALLDAVGETIVHIREKQLADPPEEKTEKTLFVISTDGLENASHKYGIESIRSMITYLEENEHWEFVYLGAGPDTIQESYRMGIRNAEGFENSELGERRKSGVRQKKLKNFLD